jgi:glycosyl transferase family 1
VTFWNAFEGAGQLLRRGGYDAVILHTTLLCLRWFDNFAEWRRKLSWLRDLDCIKIAMPQDEYNHSAVLDEWLNELGVDHVFSNFGIEVQSLVYPQLSQHAKFQSVFTGYIDENVASSLETRLTLSKHRPLDVVYRANHPQYWFGSLGQLKYLVGERALLEAKARGLKADISSETGDAILGDDWFDFLAAGRVVVGCQSGSSVLDRRGEMQASVRAYLQEHPGATFDEVSSRMPEGWDSYDFGVISPRHFEAVITKTCQVLVRGRYDDVLVPGRHYIAVQTDLADLGDALEAASDPAVASEFAARAYEEIYRSGRYTYRALAEQIDRVLDAKPPFTGARVPGASVVARFGSWRLNRPAGFDAGLTLARFDPTPVPSPPADPRIQLWGLLRHRSDRQVAIGALGGRLSRGLLITYLRAGDAASSIPAGRLLAEGRLLDSLSSAQAAQPQTLSSRTIKAVVEGKALDLSVLRKPPNDGEPSRDLIWPPPSIIVRMPSFGGLAGEAVPSGVRLDAVSALAAIRPVAVQRTVRQLLDSIGGARSRPRLRSVRSQVGSLLATTRVLVAQPLNLWVLAAALGRAPLRDIADDLLKLELLRRVKASGHVASRIDMTTSTLSLVTEPGVAPGGQPETFASTEVRRVVWDHSAISDHLLANVGFGRRLRVYLGARGVHEFTAIEALPASARKAVLRQLGS